MKKYSVAMVRERLSEALDQAERGNPVVIERRGVTYELTVQKSARRKKRRTPQIEILDRALITGQWTWDWQDGELQIRTCRQ